MDISIVSVRNGHLMTVVQQECIIYGRCLVTNEHYSVAFKLDQWMRWNNGGKHIQTAMPDLSDGDREFIISGTSPKGWDKLFPKEEEEDEGESWGDYYNFRPEE